MNNMVSADEKVLQGDALEILREDVARSQRCGLPFIIASVVIWTMIFVVTNLKLPIATRNFITFCCSCPLLPLSYMIGRILKVDIFEKKNPLTSLGFLFTCNQMIYLLIVMWVFNAVPEKMVMVYAMVFGAHLLPYSWLYKTKAYMVFAIIEPIIALVVGCMFTGQLLAGVMIVEELVFSVILLSRKK